MDKFGLKIGKLGPNVRQKVKFLDTAIMITYVPLILPDCAGLHFDPITLVYFRARLRTEFGSFLPSVSLTSL